MFFEPNHLYHIYNQGNNRNKVFLCRDHYLFFKRKLKRHILPFADILAWCLMPNHFHLMIHVNNVEVDKKLIINKSGRDLKSHPDFKRITLNQSIGIMLASYTRAINKQRNRRGSLFRKETKAVCLSRSDGISPSWYTIQGITSIHVPDTMHEYPYICYRYILYNPVHAGLVNDAMEWEFSSFREIVKSSSDSLISRDRITYYGLKL